MCAGPNTCGGGADTCSRRATASSSNRPSAFSSKFLAASGCSFGVMKPLPASRSSRFFPRRFDQSFAFVFTQVFDLDKPLCDGYNLWPPEIYIPGGSLAGR
jgi:hypothetical protein